MKINWSYLLWVDPPLDLKLKFYDIGINNCQINFAVLANYKVRVHMDKILKKFLKLRDWISYNNIILFYEES